MAATLYQFGLAVPLLLLEANFRTGRYLGPQRIVADIPGQVPYASGTIDVHASVMFGSRALAIYHDGYGIQETSLVDIVHVEIRGYIPYFAVLDIDGEMHLSVRDIVAIFLVVGLRGGQGRKVVMLLAHRVERKLMTIPSPYG